MRFSTIKLFIFSLSIFSFAIANGQAITVLPVSPDCNDPIKIKFTGSNEFRTIDQPCNRYTSSKTQLVEIFNENLAAIFTNGLTESQSIVTLWDFKTNFSIDYNHNEFFGKFFYCKYSNRLWIQTIDKRLIGYNLTSDPLTLKSDKINNKSNVTKSGQIITLNEIKINGSLTGYDLVLFDGLNGKLIRRMEIAKINNYEVGYDEDYLLINGNYINLKTGEDSESKSFLAKKELEKLNDRILQSMQEWTSKGKYEKTLDYEARVTDETIKKKYHEVRKEETLKIFEAVYSSTFFSNPRKIDYNADTEVMSIKYEGFDNVVFNISPENAQFLEENISSSVIQPTLEYEDKNFIIQSLIFSKNERTFQYNSENKLDFTAEYLALGVKDVDIKSFQVEINEKSNIYNISKNIPLTNRKNWDAVAVVIGNRNYQKTANVDYALQDAFLMKEYLISILGYQPGNIFFIANASKGDFELYFGTASNHKGKLFNTIKEGVSDVFIYYSGHGAPNIQTQEGYFVPVESDPLYIDLTGYSIETFYNNLAQLSAKSITVVTDACFSGASVLTKISPVGIKSKSVHSIPSGVVINSSSGEQVSSWYPEAKNGLFTYYFLKGIHSKEADLNQDGQITYQEIYDYLADNQLGVPYYARRLHGIQQQPTITGQNLDAIFVKY